MIINLVILNKLSTMGCNIYKPNYENLSSQTEESPILIPKTNKVIHVSLTKSMTTQNKDSDLQHVLQNCNDLAYSKQYDQNIEEMKASYSEVLTKMKYSIAGLKNIGNTCFLNTAIKCLVSNTPFVLLFNSIASCLNSEYKSYLQELIGMFKGILIGGTFSPSLFKKQLGLLDPTFNGLNQNDCFQALISILDNAHKGIKLDPTKHSISFPTEACGKDSNNEYLFGYIRKCIKILETHTSLVYDMFLNMCVNQYECLKCEAKQIKFDINTGLPLDISKMSDLNECIKSYYKTELYSDYKCRSCGEKVDIKVTRVPIFFAPIVILQLKRFKMDFSTMKEVKDNTVIRYPIMNSALSLKQFVPKYVIKEFYGGGLRRRYNLDYYLTGAGIHSGSLNGGHYYSHIYNCTKNEWECHNDSYVHSLNVDEAQNNGAITLTFMRKDMFEYKQTNADYIIANIFS